MDRKRTTKCSKQNTLQKFGFNQKITKRITPRNREEKKTLQTQLDTTNIHYDNTFKGDKISTFNKDCIRILYLNINGINLKKGAHSLVQLCLNLKKNCRRYHKSNRDECSLEKEPYYIKIQKFTEKSLVKQQNYL